MKLVYPFLNLDMNFEENSINSLIIENQNMFSEIITDFYNQIEGYEGKIVLSENYMPIEIRKIVELITQFIPFTLNKKELLTKLYGEIQKNAVSPEMLERTNGILAELERYIFDISNIFENEPECTVSSDIVPLLKMFNTSFSENGKELCEKLLDYFELAERYKNKKLFITVNLRSYIDDEKAELFFKNVIMRKTVLLTVENYAYKKLAYEKRTIIDEDLCII
ncbi:MAG: type II-A CRISPR-associated protein Csn2 [Eubacterium sp.]|nr:type II-A CRISPR-associated protein Csn2 [Eubacterium sp.]